MSSQTYDFEIDYEQFQEMAEMAMAILHDPETPVRPITLYWGNSGEWCQVCDLFGRMIRGVDWPMEVGEVYQLEDLTLPWNPGVEVPCRIRVLKTATHREAEAIAGRKLARRKFYYEVISD